ncbi:MAG: alkaline phosphatase family protein [Myxococcota bacterium]
MNPLGRIHPSLASLACAAAVVLLAGCGTERPTPDARPQPAVVILGFDGADLRWVDRLHAEGRLPHIGGLVERGVSAPLETVHYWSPIIWTSMATGVRPERHGIGAFLIGNDVPAARPGGRGAPPPDEPLVPVADDYEPQKLVDASKPASVVNRRRPAFWNVLSHYDRSVGVLAWWATYPAEPVDGFVVSPYLFFGAPKKGKPTVVVEWKDDDPRRTYPPELAEELRPFMRTDADLAPAELRGVAGTPRQTAYTPWIVARDLGYFDAALHLLETRPVDTLALFFQGIDVAGHDFTEFVFGANVNRKRKARVRPAAVRAATARVEAMYERADAMVGRLLERLPAESDVLLVSDHGWEFDGTSHWNLNPGVFVAAGPSFRRGVRTDGVTVLDVAPLVYAAQGVPVADALDGDVPPGVLRPEVEARVTRVDDYPVPPHSLPAGSDGSAPEDEAYIELLKGLGYVE